MAQHVDPRSTARRTVFLALAALALFVAAWVARENTPPDSYARDLTGLVLTAAVTAGTAFAASTAGTRRAMRQRRDTDTIREIEADSRAASVRLGALEIPDLILFSIADGRTPTATFDFPEVLAAPRPDPEEYEQLQRTLIPRHIEVAAARNAPFTDDPAVDLVSAVRQVLPRASGGQRVTWRLEFAQTSYYRFAALANANADEIGSFLEDPVALLSERNIGTGQLDDLAARRIPAKVGTGTVVQTLDGSLVGMIRGATYQVGADGTGLRKIHIVGEGMMPTDVRFDRINPEAAARRGLFEELGAAAGEPALEFTGMFFDLGRHQPVFCYLARIGVPFSDLHTDRLLARDGWETDGIVRLGPDIDEDLRRLLLGRFPGSKMASNHATMALVLALGRLHGFRHVREALVEPG